MPGLADYYRKSPLGIREIVNPLLDDHLGLTFPPVFGSNPMIMYKPGYENDPENMTHERIHASQFLQPNQPSRAEIEKIFGQSPVDPSNVVVSKSVQNNPVGEAPAYRFAKPEDTPESFGSVPDTPLFKQWAQGRQAEVQKQQDELNAYLDLMHRRNPNQVSALEAVMPERLITEYVKSHPRPLEPKQPEVRTHGVIETLRRALGY